MPLSRRTLIAFREYLVSWTLREIADEFDAAGILPVFTHEPEVSGERRRSVEQHYAALDLEDPEHERRLLEAYEGILMRSEPEAYYHLTRYLERDGFTVDKGRILYASNGTELTAFLRSGHAGRLSHLQQHVGRITSSLDTDPGLAIGSAKELVETCCKTILRERDVAAEESLDLPKLVKLTANALELLPEHVSDATKGAGTIKRTLSNLGSLARGLAELRNLYGSGHGRDGQWRGVTPRHARLAVGAAATLAVFLMETHWEKSGTASNTDGPNRNDGGT